jgi:hypothetical protein
MFTRQFYATPIQSRTNMARREQSGLLASILGRLERSQHMFLAGLVAAFAVEIAVDWNSTFRDVNVLRGQLRDKASHIAAILRLAAHDPLAAGDKARLEQLGRRVLEDDEVTYVRVTDAEGAPIVEVGDALAARYPKQLKRDVAGMLNDPNELRQKIAQSRHRDIFQAITDAEDSLVVKLGGQPAEPPKGMGGAVAYQDRLYDEATRDEDRTVTWALAVIDGGPGGKPAGLVLIALKTDRLREQVAKKLWKGAAITLFFLGVILVQQVSSRRAKMRLLSLRDALAAARSAISAALPEAPPALDGLEGALAFEQAERLGGTVYDFGVAPGKPRAFDVFLAAPEGSGVDVAFASVFVRDEQRRLRREIPDTAPEPLLTALAGEYGAAPIHRRLDLALFRVDLARGEVAGVTGGMDPPSVIDAAGAPIEAALEPFSGAAIDQSLVEPPVRRFRAPFPPGATLVLYTDGLPDGAARPIEPADVIARAADPKPIAQVVESIRDFAMKRAGGALADDLFLLILRRSA